MADQASRRRRRQQLATAEAPEEEEEPAGSAAAEPEADAPSQPQPADVVSQRRRRRQQTQEQQEAPQPGGEREASSGSADATEGSGAAVLTAAQLGGREPFAEAPPTPERSTSPALPQPDEDPLVRAEESSEPRRAPVASYTLPEEERQLLENTPRIDRGDIYPKSAEPHFLIEPPAPEIGEVDARYVEVPNAVRFKRVRAAGSTLPALPRMDADADADALADAPSGGVQLAMTMVGVVIHVAHGALAGSALMQLVAAPWPDDGTLTRPLAYAPLALPLQRTLSFLALLAFLAAADLHAAATSTSTVVLLLLHALIVVTTTLELPTTIALHEGRAAREAAFTAPLLDVLANVTNTTFEPQRLPEAALEAGGGPFSTALSAAQLDFWQVLVTMRALLALLCWLIACLLQSHDVFEVPPILIHGDDREHAAD